MHSILHSLHSTLWLAMAEAAESGFGLEQVLESNLINLAITISVLVYFGRKLVGNTLAERRSQIENEIKEAEQRCQEAAVALAEQQQKLAQAQTEASQILAKAEETAHAIRESILAQATADVERLRATATQDLQAEQERAIAELRQRVVAMALQRAEEQLPARLSDTVQQRLIDRGLALLGDRT
ncbi:F0F1 ATP synthase subunit B [Trichothermofontia sp.]